MGLVLEIKTIGVSADASLVWNETEFQQGCLAVLDGGSFGGISLFLQRCSLAEAR